MKIKHLWIFSFFLLLLSCKENKNNAAQDNTSEEVTESSENMERSKTSETGALTVLDGTWMLETFNKETIETTDAYKIPTLEIKADEGKIIGNAGCNEYKGEIAVRNESEIDIKAEKISNLECPESSLEEEFLNAIKANDLVYKMQDKDQLIFFTDKVTMMFKRSM